MTSSSVYLFRYPFYDYTNAANTDTRSHSTPDYNANKPGYDCGMNSIQSRLKSRQGGINSWQNGMGSGQFEMKDMQNGVNIGQNGLDGGQSGMDSGKSGMNNGQRWTRCDQSSTGVRISLSEEVYNDLLDRKSELEKENARLKNENDVLWNQSAEVFQQNRDKRLEMVNDPYSLNAVVDGFRHLHTADWVDIWEEGEDDCSTIQQISDMLKVVNKKCTKMANQQIRSYVCLGDKNDHVPTRQEKPDVYRLRRKVSIDPYVRENVTTRIVSELLDDSSHPNIYTNAEGTEEKGEVRNFFKNFADFCWLLAIAEERVIVYFDVIGKDYEDIKDHFDKYFPKHNVTGTKYNSVKTLVWPCIKKEDGTLLEKGHVIVVENVETHF